MTRIYSTQKPSKVCAICGTTRNVENAHLTNKGMGGIGHKADKSRHDTAPICAGSGGNTDTRSCHGMHHAGHLEMERADGQLWFTVNKTGAENLASRGLAVNAYEPIPARFECCEPDELPDRDQWGMWA